MKSVICASILMLFVWLFFSCESQVIKIGNLENSDTISRDIPKAFQNKTTRDKNNSLNNALGLKTLENGFDGLQIRIWRGYTVKDTGQLLSSPIKN